MLKKNALLFFFAFGLMFCSNAQNKHAVGLALGAPTGVTFKTFISSKNALDFTLGYGWSDYYYYGVSGLFEIHAPIVNAPGLSFYYGPGTHMGTWNEKGHSGLFLGVDGVIGLEYLIPTVPVPVIAISLDFRPGFNLLGHYHGEVSHYFFYQSQLGIKYSF